MVFIRDLVIKKGLTNYNANIILIKTRLFIEIIKSNNHKKTELCFYLYFSGQLIYCADNIMSYIIFVVR